MSHVAIRFSLATLLIFTLTGRSNAQSGGQGSSGLGGSGTSGLSGSTSYGSTSTGTSSTGTSSTGTSSTGTSQTSGSGATGTSQTGSTVGSTTNGSNATQSFIGGNQTEGFVGGARESTQTQNMNRQFQAIQSTQSQSSQQTTGTPRSIRTALSVGFSFPSPTMPEVSARLANANQLSLGRFAAARPEFASITVAVNSQGVAVLSGTTASTESKRLAANLIRLQPGVRKVDNQLAVSN